MAGKLESRFVFLSWISVIADMILSTECNLLFCLAWRLPSGKCQLIDLLFILHLQCFFCCVLRCVSRMEQRGLLRLEVKGIQQKTVFTDAVPITLSKFSQNQSLTFRVDSTVFNVLVIYLKAWLIFILAFNIWHIPITKGFCQKQSKSQLKRKRCTVWNASPPIHSS